MSEGTEETTPQPASERLRVADHKPSSVVPLVVISVVASLLGIALGLLIDWWPEAASTQSEQVDTFYDVMIILSVPMFVLVTAVVLYCVYRFRMQPGEEEMDGPPWHGNTRLEIIWTAIPAVMMIALCAYAAIELHNAEKAPAATAGQPELQVRVVGEQFTWTFYYPQSKVDGKEIASNQLYLPNGRSVHFKVQTKDVLHDFWVPAFRWKIDAVPGITTDYRVTPKKLGDYPVVCAELCGLGHAVMRQTAHVLPEAGFQDWLKTKAEPAGVGSETDKDDANAGSDGADLFATNGCGGCHTLKAAGSNGQNGPNLTASLKGQSAAEIRASIVDPNAEIVKGYGANIMPPNYGDTFSPQELDALVKYLQESQEG